MFTSTEEQYMNSNGRMSKRRTLDDWPSLDPNMLKFACLCPSSGRPMTCGAGKEQPAAPIPVGYVYLTIYAKAGQNVLCLAILSV